MKSASGNSSQLPVNRGAGAATDKALDHGDQLDPFEAYRRRKNVNDIRFGVLQPLILVPPFIIPDFLLIPARYFWYIQTLRVLCLSFAGWLLWAAKKRQRFVANHGDVLWASLMWMVGFFVSCLAWCHTGYSSAYSFGLVFVFVGTVFAINWPVTRFLVFLASVYLTYLAPFLIGAIEMNVSGVTLVTQLFIPGLMMEVSLLNDYKYKSTKREFYDLLNLNQANEQLDQLNRTKDRFFATISHELRTPLALSIGPVESLLEEVAVPAQREKLVMVQQNQARLLREVDELLALAKLQAGEVRGSFQQADLRALVERIANAARGAIEAKGIALHAELPEEPVHAFVDVEKLDRVLLNLVNNAFKFTPEGGRVTLALADRGDHAEVQVADTGIGISKEQQKLIFERFYQVDSSETRAYEGTGIGLSIVKEYVELHGGRVSLHSEEGEGSRFTIALKYGDAHLPKEQLTQEPLALPTMSATEGDLDAWMLPEGNATEGTTSEPPGAVKRNSDRPGPADADTPLVLIADDTPGIRRHLRSLLEHEYRVVTARDGQEALEKARAETPDLILSDLMMPRLSGAALCKEVKAAEGALSRVPVILLTARADKETKEAVLDVGADDYLVKPCPNREVQLRVRNHVVRYLQEKSLRQAYEDLDRMHTRVVAQQGYIQRDLRDARRFQEGLLSPVDRLELVSGEAVLRPVQDVGGDLFHVMAIGDKRVRIFVVDITDHGVKAAVRASALWAEYTFLNHEELSPELVLQRLNDASIQKYGDLTGCALCMDLWRPEAPGRPALVRYAQAGEAPFLKAGGEGVRHGAETDDFLLGMIPGITYTLREDSLAESERLFIYTDGIYNQLNPGGETSRALLNDGLWKAAAEAPSVSEGLHLVLARIDQFRASSDQVDDMTVLSFELRH